MTTGNEATAGRSRGRMMDSSVLPATLLFAAAFLLYAATSNRWIQWQDSGELILRIVTGELEHRLGLALAHPLHYWLGRAALKLLFLEPPFAITLVSALGAAIAVANVFGCVRTLTGRHVPALLAAGSLALAHTVWQMATRTEAYTLTIALLAGECWCIAAYAVRGGRWPLCVLSGLNGLGLANHLFALLTTPVIAGLWIHQLYRRRVRASDAIVAAVLWLIGSLPYTGLVVVQWLHTGDLESTLHSALFGRAYAGSVLNLSISFHMLVMRIGFILLNFPHLLLPFAAYGLIRWRRIGIPLLAVVPLGAALLVHLFFALRYEVIDWHEFLLPSLVLLAVFGGIGFAAVPLTIAARKARAILTVSVVLLALTPAWYALLPDVARRLDVLGAAQRHKPYRDDYVYVFTPWSSAERSARRLSRETIDLAGNDGLIVVEDGMASFAVKYQVLRRKLDCRIITLIPAPPGFEDADPLIPVAQEAIHEAARLGRPVVLVPHNVEAPPRTRTTAGIWKRAGDLYLLDPKPRE